MSRQEEMRARLELVGANLEVLSVAFSTAIETGHASRSDVVLLLDVRDRVARELASAIAERSVGFDFNANVDRIGARGMIPTAVAVLPVDLARALFSRSHPSVAKGITIEPAPDLFRVAVVGRGGTSLLHLPLLVVKNAGSA